MPEQAQTPADLLRRLLEEPDACPDSEEIAVLAEAFPYLALPAAMRLRRAPAASVDTDDRRELMARVAFGVPGRNSLFRLSDPDGNILAGFMPPPAPAAAPATTTDSAIDTFLATYGRMSEQEEALLEKMIFNPVPDDYAALLAREEAESGAEKAATRPSDAQDKLFDAFLAAREPEESLSQPSPQPQPATPVPELVRPAPRVPKKIVPPVATPSPTSSLSESLAQVYIKRGRYDKAYDIIHALSLNNPKKSVYFADQLRFLQKLMLNQQCATLARNGQK